MIGDNLSEGQKSINLHQDRASRHIMISLPCLLFLPMVSSNVGVEIKKKENIIKVKVVVV